MATLKKDRYKLNRRFLICLSVSAIAISIMAIIIGIIALCFAVYRTPLLGFDYMGLLVGILAALVTALIGWQIFTTIGVEKKVSDIEKKVAKINCRLEEEKEKIEIKLKEEGKERISNRHFFSGLINFVQAMALQASNDKRYLMVYNFYILAINTLLKSNDKKIVSFINAIIHNIEICIEKRKSEIDYDDNNVDINKLNERINEIIMSESPYFTPDQRREFMHLDTM